MAPSSPWQPFVETYFEFSGPAPLLILPTGGVDLLIVRAATEVMPATFMVHGHLDEAFRPGAMELHGIGIRFRPGGFTAVTKIPQSEGRGRIFDLAELVRPELLSRLERIVFDTTDKCGGAARMERVIHEVAPKGTVGPAWIGEINRFAAMNLKVSELARQIGMSPRKLERVSDNFLGLGPKKLTRIMRLRRALRLRIRGGTWSEAALAAGFADQAHLSRESRSIFGVSPTTCLAQWRQGRVFRI